MEQKTIIDVIKRQLAESRRPAQAQKFNTVTDAMDATGTSCPSEARKALTAQNKKLSIRGHYQYKPHIGAKQRAKERRRFEKASAKAGLPDVSVP